ncbi:hypothetical protein TcWFU_004634 [Taenia crassiceps]|uniref:Uncharacterized protein n=1 Tax=Taenia crassiceps TaxID=6207 RepID=A0ABR4QQU2_9CEST
MSGVKLPPISTGSTNGVNNTSLNFHLEGSFRVSTIRAQHKLVNESIKQLLESSSIMGTVDYISIILIINMNLGTQLAAKILCDIYKSSTIVQTYKLVSDTDAWRYQLHSLSPF